MAFIGKLRSMANEPIRLERSSENGTCVPPDPERLAAEILGMDPFDHLILSRATNDGHFMQCARVGARWLVEYREGFADTHRQIMADSPRFALFAMLSYAEDDDGWRSLPWDEYPIVRETTIDGRTIREVELYGQKFRAAVRCDGQIDGIWTGPDGQTEDGAVVLRDGERKIVSGCTVLPLRPVLEFWVPLTPNGVYTHRFSTGIKFGERWTFTAQGETFVVMFGPALSRHEIAKIYGEDASHRCGDSGGLQIRFHT